MSTCRTISTLKAASFVAGLLVLGIGLAGCSSSHSTATNKTTSSVPDGLSAVRSALQDQAAASKTKLLASDLPATWTPGAVKANDKSGGAQMSRCLGIPNSDTEETAYTGSPIFSHGTGLEVYSQATVYTSVAVVQDDLRGLRGPLASCLTQLATSIGATNVQVRKIALPVTAGALPGFRVTGGFDVPSSSGTPQHVRIDEVALAKDRMEIAITMNSSGADFPAGLMSDLTAKLAQRLRTATT